MHVFVAIHKDNSYTTTTSLLSSDSALKAENEKQAKEMMETTQSRVANNAYTNSSSMLHISFYIPMTKV